MGSKSKSRSRSSSPKPKSKPQTPEKSVCDAPEAPTCPVMSRQSFIEAIKKNPDALTRFLYQASILGAIDASGTVQERLGITPKRVEENEVDYTEVYNRTLEKASHEASHSIMNDVLSALEKFAK